MAGAINSRFRPAGAGAYYVVTTSGGCPSLPSEALNYIITATEPSLNTITVYPNPASNQFRVRWLNNGATGQLALTDFLGRTVRQQPQTGEVTEFNVSELEAGTYLLTLRAEGIKTQVRKVQVR